MRVTFIQPKVGGKPGVKYPATWKMEPLWAAALAAQNPPEIDREFMDDRVETVPEQHATDLAAISVETYTARRAYEIADGYRRRGVPVVLGGFHVTLVPHEAAAHADAIVIGPAEDVWPALLEDLRTGLLNDKYVGRNLREWLAPQPDRSVYSHYRYGPLRLVETSRGCPHRCEFCSISSVYRRAFAFRPVAEVVEDIRRCAARLVFFVDDNLIADEGRLRELCEALVPLRIRWIGQIGIRVAEDESLLRLLKRSGCAGVLIGFESLNTANLVAMRKPVAGAGRYDEAVHRLSKNGLSIYGTFVFGYDDDTEATFASTLDFAVRHRFFFAAFNHLVPFPGTPLYERLKSAGRLKSPHWWLDGDYRFGDVAFQPARVSASELAALCSQYRRRFYRLRSICSRIDWRSILADPFKTFAYFQQNFRAADEVERRLGLSLGNPV